jgi:hypothetical protein
MSQFVLGLESHFRTVAEAAARGRVNGISWRCDHIDVDDGTDISSDERWKDRVRRWVEEVRSSSTDGSRFVFDLALYGLEERAAEGI